MVQVVAQFFKWLLLVNRFIYFLKLCMKLEINKGKKVMKPDFSGKFIFSLNWAKTSFLAQKWTFSIIFQIPLITFG
jgi:hypothetical protein